MKSSSMHRLSSICATLAAALLFSIATTTPASASPPDPAPSQLYIAPVLGNFAEHLILERDANSPATRRLWWSGLSLGARYPLAGRTLWGGRLGADTSLGVARLTGPGDWLIPLRQGIETRWGAGSWSVALGAELGLQTNLSEFSSSFLDAGPRLSLGVWRLDLSYAPSVSFGLGRDTETAFGGERRRGVARGGLQHRVMLSIGFDVAMPWSTSNP